MDEMDQEITTEVVVVTPELATQWLLRNKSIRHLRVGVVKGYTRDMADGNWRLTGEAIKFDPHGNVLDGQHRLHAVIDSGAHVPMVIVRGIAPDDQKVMDTGAKRTIGDALEFEYSSIRNGARVAALVNILSVAGGWKETYTRLTVSEVLEAVNDEPLLVEICSEIVPSFHINLATPAVLDYTYYHLQAIDRERAQEFFRLIGDPIGQASQSPILALHRRLQSPDLMRSTRGRDYRMVCIAAIFTAWNAWRRVETRSVIKVMRDDRGRIYEVTPIAGSRPPVVHAQPTA